MSVKIIINMNEAVIRKARAGSSSSYVAVPKQWNGKKVLCIPIPRTLEPHINELTQQERIIINDAPIFIKTPREYQKYVHVIYVPKEYRGREIIITPKGDTKNGN